MIEIVNDRSNEYNTYLTDHISNVKRSWEEILFPALLTESDLTVEDFTKISDIIDCHDSSKYDEEEYDAYLDYFYPMENSNPDSDVEVLFNQAWLHHQKNNPHHWQYWILVKDEGKLEPIDMSFEAICEMLCDWSSFQYKYPGSTANAWYKENKSKMIISNNTRKLVEKYLELCPNL